MSLPIFDASGLACGTQDHAERHREDFRTPSTGAGDRQESLVERPRRAAPRQRHARRCAACLGV